MKSILLIGLCRFGKNIAMRLNQLGHEVMAVDHCEERVDEVISYVTNAQIGDSTNVEFLKSLGVRNFDVCIVTIDSDFQGSLETICNLKELGAKLVVARASSDVHAKFLLRNGADEILYPEEQLARWVAVRYGSNHILDYIEIDDSHAIYEVEVPQNWLGMSIQQIDIRKKYNISILALKEDGKLSVVISPDTVLRKEMSMLVLGEYKTLKKCFHIY